MSRKKKRGEPPWQAALPEQSTDEPEFIANQKLNRSPSSNWRAPPAELERIK